MCGGGPISLWRLQDRSYLLAITVVFTSENQIKVFRENVIYIGKVGSNLLVGHCGAVIPSLSLPEACLVTTLWLESPICKIEWSLRGILASDSSAGDPRFYWIPLHFPKARGQTLVSSRLLADAALALRWCNRSGHSFSPSQPRVVTPSGNQGSDDCGEADHFLPKKYSPKGVKGRRQAGPTQPPKPQIERISFLAVLFFSS